MARSRLSFLVALLLVAAPLVTRATPRETLLVSTAWLASHQHDPNLVMLHVGDKAEYDARHIAGARYLDTHELGISGVASGGLTLEMPPPEQLRAGLANAGISADSHVVVYYGNDSISPATRVMFTLDYAGVDRAALLDGGLSAWIRDGHDVTSEVPAPRAGTLSDVKPRPLIVDADFVQSHVSAPGFSVVDARTAGFYDGTQLGGPRDHRLAGHIAGARSVPFTSLFRDDLTLKSTDELNTIFTNAGVRPGDTVVAYCHIGQQATALLFAARTLGHPVLLYDGSFEDWARRGLPVSK